MSKGEFWGGDLIRPFDQETNQITESHTQKETKKKTKKDKAETISVESEEILDDPEQQTNREVKLVKTISRALVDIDKSLHNKDLHFSDAERSFLEWLKMSIKKIDGPPVITKQYLMEISVSPVDMLIEGLKLIDAESSKLEHGFNHQKSIDLLLRNSVNYFKRFPKRVNEEQHPFTEKEAYFLSLPESAGYRNFLIHKYAKEIEGFDNMDRDQQDYQLAMRSYNQRRIVKLSKEDDYFRDFPATIDIEDLEAEVAKRGDPPAIPEPKQKKNLIKPDKEEYQSHQGDLIFDYDQDVEDADNGILDYDKVGYLKISTPEIQKHEILLSKKLTKMRKEMIEYQPWHEQGVLVWNKVRSKVKNVRNDLPKFLERFRDVVKNGTGNKNFVKEVQSSWNELKHAVEQEEFNSDKWAEDIRSAFIKAGIKQNPEDMNLLLTLAGFETCFQSGTLLDTLKEVVNDKTNGLAGETVTIGATQLSYKLIQQLHYEKFNMQIPDNMAKKLAASTEDNLMYTLLYLQKLKVPYNNIANEDEKVAYIFADWNAGEFRSRNAGFQKAVAELSGENLDLDGTMGPKTYDAILNLLDKNIDSSHAKKDKDEIAAIKASMIENLDLAWKLRDTNDFPGTQVWKDIELLYRAKGHEITPVVADAKVLDRVSKLISKTSGSKEFSEKATKIYKDIISPSVEEYFEENSEYQKPEKREVLPATPEAALLELKQELNIHSEVEFSSFVNHLGDKKKIQAVVNLKLILQRIDPTELHELFNGLEKVVIEDKQKQKVWDQGRTIYLGVFKRKKDKEWISLPNNEDALEYVKEGLNKAYEARNHKDTARSDKDEKLSNPVLGSLEGLKIKQELEKQAELKQDKKTEEAIEPIENLDNGALFEKPSRKKNKKEKKGKKSRKEFESEEGDFLEYPVEEAIKEPIAEAKANEEESGPSPEELLLETEVHGDDESVTPELLLQYGILPEFELPLFNRKVYLSKCFELANGYLGVIGFVENDEGKLVARSYYKSRTGGAVWRYLPAYVGKHLGKGHYDKNSVVAPTDMQFAFAVISSDHDHVENINREQAEKVFYGTAKAKYNEPDKQADEDEGRYTYYSARGVEKDGYRLPGNLGAEGGIYTNQIDPEKLEITDQEIRPDFSEIGKEGNTWAQKISDPITNREYKIEVDVIPSRDGTINYMFCWDKDEGRAWVGMVELAKEEISETGLKKRWVDAGRLVTPIIDHEEHDIDHYGVPIPGNSNYVDMFPNYVNKIPEVKKYIGVKKALEASKSK